MKKKLILVIAGFTAITALTHGAIPSGELYPFRGFDLALVRAKTKAESGADSPDLREASQLFAELQGSWAPNAHKPAAATVARLDELKKRLESRPKPAWFLETLKSPGSGATQLADKIGDAIFEQQKATFDYQEMKALAVVCLAEHELDRPGAAETGGAYLMVLSITHPWDWEVHGLYARLLVDAQRNGPAWAAVRQSLFLNPEPTLADLKFFAFVGSVTAKKKWPEIQIAMQQAALDSRVAELAIVESARLFSEETKVNLIAPKRP